VVQNVHLGAELINYKIDYIADNEIVETIYATIVNIDSIEKPEIPEKPGYTASWENFELLQEPDIQVHAVYELIPYRIVFKIDQSVVKVVEYDAENLEITEPDIPDKPGFNAKWEDYTLEFGDDREITVNAEYTPIEYTASFVLFDDVLETQTNLTYTTTFNIVNQTITLPTVNEDYNTVTGCEVIWDEPEFEYKDAVIEGHLIDVDNYAYLKFKPIRTDSAVTSFSVSGLSSRAFHDEASNIVIPNQYHNKPVTYIEKSAFAGNLSSITNQYIETIEICGIERIEEFAFYYCRSLKNVILHSGTTTIGEQAFASNYLLKNISIPDSVSEIGKAAFDGCGFENVTLPNGINKIAENLFNNCSNLTEITIPQNVTEIASGAFSNCISLHTVNLGQNIEVIRTDAFIDCTSLSEITITKKVQLIECYAFNGCTGLVSVTILSSDETWYYYDTNTDPSKKQIVSQSILTNSSDMIAIFLGSDFTLVKADY
ncbi:MAG: leucine-rich repeat domain-containing protein, partial [Clostridia bacterium]|nr:leucine-rich repeat domain-containing protein [Clostridia bacterium]